MKQSIGNFLLRRLQEAGIRHIFGVPGDYNLELLQQLQDAGTLEWIGTTGELNASYAADGYARLNGLGALLVTNGVGALSAINGVGGSYSEHVPVICIAGSIPLRSIDRGLGMHHTMADGTWDHFLDAYSHVTAAHARLTPRNAATEIDRLILTAWREKLPVYMELPSDIAYLDIEVPADPLMLAEPPSDPERLRSCVAAITRRLTAATSPAILVDADADRFGVASELMELAEKTQAPVAVINTAKAVIDETFPHYVGIYMGKASEPHVREAIETSDCLLAIGYRPIEVTTGDYETWKYIAPIQKAAWSRKTFEYGTWGGEIRSELAPQPGDIVAQEHWCSSGFANTDLDLQLKKHGIHQLIIMGLIAHTCVEATVRYASELGYQVTMVKDATADYSDEEMHAALDVNIPNYASAIVSTKEIVDTISSL